MSKRDAEKFIADLMTEEEAVGEVKSVTGARPGRSTMSSRKRKSSIREEENQQEKAEPGQQEEGGDDDEEDDASAASEMAIDA